MPIDPTLPYDEGNVFAKILRGELPCNKVYEDDHALAFHDIRPQAPVHVLVIPKGAYVEFDDFAKNASAEEITDYIRAIGQVCAELGLSADSAGQGGFRLIANAGRDSGQEVPHLHVHLLAGRALGPLLARP